MIKRQRREQGDTIVEVVLAFAIFSLAAVSSMQILSKGVAATQRNLELTLVREQVDSQAEMLRYIRDSDDGNLKRLWASLVAPDALVATPSSLSDSCTVAPRAFYLSTVVNTARPNDTTISRVGITDQLVSLGEGQRGNYTYAQMSYNGESISGSTGIWIEAARAEAASSTSGPQAYDFYIHACWDSVGLNTPMTSGTIVRIYE